MHVRLTSDSKWTVGVSVIVYGCVGPVMDWHPVQGVPRCSPGDSWDRLQLAVTLNSDELENYGCF